MAANEYLQAAAGQLQNAAQAVKTDMDKALADFMAYEKQAKNDISSMTAAMAVQTVQLGAAGDPQTARQASDELQRLRGAIDDKKRELEERRAEIQSTVKDKQGAVSGLVDQAKGLQNQASSLK